MRALLVPPVFLLIAEIWRVTDRCVGRALHGACASGHAQALHERRRNFCAPAAVCWRSRLEDGMRRRHKLVVGVVCAGLVLSVVRWWFRVPAGEQSIATPCTPKEVAYPGAIFRCQAPDFFLTNDSAAEIVAFYRDPARPHKLHVMSWSPGGGILELSEVPCAAGVFYRLYIHESADGPTHVDVGRGVMGGCD